MMTKEPPLPGKIVSPRSYDSKEVPAELNEDIVSVSDCEIDFPNEYFSKKSKIRRKRRIDS